MALRYSGTTIGTFTLCQPVRELQGEEYALKRDERGRVVYKTFPIQIRQSNCLFAALHIYKIDNPEKPKLCWRHELVNFFADERHLKNCLKDGDFEYWFSGKLRNIKLNIYYKEMLTIAKYMAKSGLKVQVYYKEPKKSKR